jgi:hypothetical protein
VLAHLRGRMGVQPGLVGLGSLATVVTVTVFYVLMLMAWRSRFDRQYGRFETFLFSCALVRFALMALPANDWASTVPPQPLSTIRNLPLLLLGGGCAYLMLRDARSSGDRTFRWIGIMILISYACYLPVILCVQQVPLVGMLMIPKTMAYVVVGVLAFSELYRQPLLSATQEGQAR